MNGEERKQNNEWVTHSFASFFLTHRLRVPCSPHPRCRSIHLTILVSIALVFFPSRYQSCESPTACSAIFHGSTLLSSLQSTFTG